MQYLDCFVEVFCWYEDKENNYVYIAMEYVAPGDLSDHINGPLHEAEVKVIMYQLFKAVAYLHERGIAHRDLKPEVRGIARS
jgi:serine/threonine protein kinase